MASGAVADQHVYKLGYLAYIALAHRHCARIHNNTTGTTDWTY